MLSLHYKNSESWFTAVSSAFREFKVNKQSEAATLLHNLLFPIACSTIEFYDMSLNPNTPHTPAFHLRFEDNAGHAIALTGALSVKKPDSYGRACPKLWSDIPLPWFQQLSRSQFTSQASAGTGFVQDDSKLLHYLLEEDPIQCFPAVPPKQPRVAVLTLLQGKHSILLNLITENREAYVSLHNYSYCTARSLSESDQTSALLKWGKLLAVMQTLTRYHWVFWTDADILILNKSVPVGRVIDDAYDFIIGGHQDKNGDGSGKGLMSGAFLVLFHFIPPISKI